MDQSMCQHVDAQHPGRHSADAHGGASPLWLPAVALHGPTLSIPLEIYR